MQGKDGGGVNVFKTKTKSHESTSKFEKEAPTTGTPSLGTYLRSGPVEATAAAATVGPDRSTTPAPWCTQRRSISNRLDPAGQRVTAVGGPWAGPERSRGGA